MLLISHVLNTRMSFRILEISQAQYFIEKHPIFKSKTYTQDTPLFYSLTTPTLVQYNSLESTITLLLEISILHQYDLVPAYRNFNLGIITHGKYLKYILPKFVYITSQGFYDLDADDCHQKQLHFTCDNLHVTYFKIKLSKHIVQKRKYCCHAENTKVIPLIVYKYTPSGKIISSEMIFHVTLRGRKHRLIS